VLVDGRPITFADGGTDVNPPPYLALHTYDSSLETRWITLTTKTKGDAVQAARERAVPSRLALHRALLRREGDTNLTTLDRLFYLGDAAHSSFDAVAWFSDT
jgi:hypothetical protein